MPHIVPIPPHVNVSIEHLPPEGNIVLDIYINYCDCDVLCFSINTHIWILG